jgi:CBS domain containing-hemolysin-like protein
MSLLDRLPVVGDRLQWNGWSMTVVAVEERRVRQVRLTPNADADAAGA